MLIMIAAPAGGPVTPKEASGPSYGLPISTLAEDQPYASSVAIDQVTLCEVEQALVLRTSCSPYIASSYSAAPKELSMYTTPSEWT